jgi:hypothetical protein
VKREILLSSKVIPGHKVTRDANFRTSQNIISATAQFQMYQHTTSLLRHTSNTCILLCGYFHKVYTISGQPGAVSVSFLPLHGYLPRSFTECRYNEGLEIYNKITLTVYCCGVSVAVNSPSYKASIYLIFF